MANYSSHISGIGYYDTQIGSQYAMFGGNTIQVQPGMTISGGLYGTNGSYSTLGYVDSCSVQPVQQKPTKKDKIKNLIAYYYKR